MIILHSMLSGCEGSKQITSVLHKHFHKLSSQCQNACTAMGEIKVIYFLPNSLFCIPLFPQLHISFFLPVLLAFPVLDWRWSVLKDPHNLNFINSVIMYMYVASTNGKSQRNGPTCIMSLVNLCIRKSGWGDSCWLIQSQQHRQEDQLLPLHSTVQASRAERPVLLCPPFI